jgi:hypothetical protein
VGGTLVVTGASTLGVLGAGASTVSSLVVNNNASVGGTLGAGSSTLSSLTVTNNATVGGTLGVTGVLNTSNDIVLANTRGIDFSATANGSGTPTTEKLTDYEEGTWVPVFEPETGAFGAITYDIVSARYTKIGNMVIAAAHMRTDGFTVGTASGDLYVAGFPYTQANIQAGGGAVTFSTGWSSNNPSGLVGFAGTNKMLLTHRITTPNTATLVTQVSSLTTGAIADRNHIVFTVTYWTV